MLDGDRIEHRIFHELPELFRPDDVLVLNETRVIAARIFGKRSGSGGSVELLLLHPAQSMRYDPAATRWMALVRPAKRLHAGARIEFPGLGTAQVTADFPEGLREVQFELSLPFETFLQASGRLPLPPYIHNDSDAAQARYQTVFARVPGSVAAPTASLHFTPALLERIRKRGVSIARITLDVGLGTFRPMKSERIDDHAMHAEHYTISEEAVRVIGKAKAAGRRIVAAGTTVIRALEGNAREHGTIVAGDGETDIFIRPGHRFAMVDAAITNFHLPKSTLLVLISALAGRARVLEAYRVAVEQEYRFFSFGDAMFVTAQPEEASRVSP